MRKTTTRLTALVLAAALLLTSCGGGASAASMHLRKTQGTVGVSDGEGKDITIRDNLGLHSGYQVATQSESYAWIDLDSVKLTKMDADSKIKILKDDKKLEINVESGSLFFNVTEPLADDEALNIRTSTMIIGVRGTCGWVGENAAALLEGTVEVTAREQSVTIIAGEMAVLTAEGTLEVADLTLSDMPAFVRDEVVENEKLTKAVLDTTGINLATYSLAPYQDTLAELEQRGEVLYTEILDFQGDGDPELLVLHTREDCDEILAYSIFWAGPEKVSHLFFSVLPARELGTNAELSLVESDGRLYLERYEKYPGDWEREGWIYGGPLADKNSNLLSWNADSQGWMNLMYSLSRQIASDTGDFIYSRYDGTRGETRSSRCTAEEFEEIYGKFSRVKLLAHSTDEQTIIIDAA